MTFSVRVSSDDAQLIKNYANIKNISVSELMRSAVFSRIEEEFDLEAYDKAMKAHAANPQTYSHDEVGVLLEFI